MLPTPHGPTDAPLPVGAVDATVGTGRTPDEGALLRVVEHLADVPDGEDAGTGASADPADATAESVDLTDATSESADQTDDAPGDDAPRDDAQADDAPVDEAHDDETPADETHDDDRESDAAAGGADAQDRTDDRHVDAVDDDDVEDATVDDEAGADGTAAPTDAAASDTPASDTPAPDPAPCDATPSDPAPDAPAPPDAPVPPTPEPGPVAAALSDTRHRIDELNAAERLFLGQQRSLVAELCADPSDAAAVGALFDRVHEQWRQAEERPDLQPLADAFGVALGDLVCADAPDLGWATCSDRYGTEIVLAREDPEVLVYPIAAVAQSWASAGPGWFVQHLRTVLQGVVPGYRPTDG